MDAGTQATVRVQLQERRKRLEQAISNVGEAPDLVRLLREVDSALKRMNHGAYGTCEVCREKVDDDFLLANPLVTYCLCELSPQQQALLQNDLELASRIQWALLPRQDLAAAGWQTHFRYEPAGAVSGDYCDLVARDAAGDLHFLVGDVSGKGVAASFLMAHLNATFRSLIEARLAVAEQVEKANRLLIENKISSHYATMVCGRAGRSGDVELCNAGHPPPLLVRRGEVEPVSASGLPIGLFGGGSYTTSRFAMAPGDTLFLYTDGVSEAHDPSGAEYGRSRLQQLLRGSGHLPPGQLARACLEDVAAFRGAASRSDDVTILVLHRTG